MQDAIPITAPSVEKAAGPDELLTETPVEDLSIDDQLLKTPVEDVSINDQLLTETLIEDVSIDGMCGVY